MRKLSLISNVRIKANPHYDAKVKIDAIARKGSEEYLLMLLSDKATDNPDGKISIAEVENYLDTNPDEAEFCAKVRKSNKNWIVSRHFD